MYCRVGGKSLPELLDAWEDIKGIKYWPILGTRLDGLPARLGPYGRKLCLSPVLEYSPVCSLDKWVQCFLSEQNTKFRGK